MLRINHEHAHVGIFDGAQRTHVAVELKILVHFNFFAEPGRIKQHEVHSELGKALVDGVAGGSGDVCDDADLFFK